MVLSFPRYLSEERDELERDLRRPGDLWSIFLRPPEGIVVTPDIRKQAFAAIDGLVLGQGTIVILFRNSLSIFRRCDIFGIQRKYPFSPLKSKAIRYSKKIFISTSVRYQCSQYFENRAC